MRTLILAQSSRLVRILSVIILLAGFVVLATVASATSRTVANTDDDGPDSLRQAILDADPGDTIDFAIPGIGPHTIVLTSGQLTIDKDLTIQGPGAGVLTISGGSASRVFKVTGDATVTISGLTITGGSAGALDGLGGGVYNRDGTLTIVESVITGNNAVYGGGVANAVDNSLEIVESVISDNTSSSEGGGILNSGAMVVTRSVVENNHSDTHASGILNAPGTLLIVDSVINGNTASGSVGGIRNSPGGQLEIVNSTIKNNEAVSFAGGIRNSGGTLVISGSEISGNEATRGGGISVGGGTATIIGSAISGNTARLQQGGGLGIEAGTVTLSTSTVSGNSATIEGGGIFNLGPLEVVNSTISGNAAPAGGGIANAGANASLTVRYSTIAFNSSGAGIGAGLHNRSGGAVMLSRSIVANSLTGVNCEGAGIVSGGYNLSDDATCGGDPTDQTGVATINLGLLSENGGLTRTHALLTGSAAIDAIPALECEVAIDQREFSRPQPVGGGCDIGAYERDDFSPPVTTATATSNSDSYTFGTPVGSPVEVTLSAVDVGSAGVEATYYSINDASCDDPDDAGCTLYTGPFTLSVEGQHVVYFFSVDRVGNIEAQQQASVWIAVNNPPVVNAPDDQIADEGTATDFNLGSFTDPDDHDSWTVTVNWGDGSSDETFAVSAPGPIGARTHTYDDDGAYTVTVTVTDEDGESDSATFEVVVANVAPTASFSAPAAVDEGSPILLKLTDPFDPSQADTAAGFSYAFDCGDGAGYGAFGPDSSVSCPTVDNETRVVGGKIRDKDGGETEYTTTVDVLNVAPSVGAISGPLDPVAVNTIVMVSADFTDPGALDTHTALIDWGDGATSLGIVTQGAGFGSVEDSHSYIEPGVYTVTVSVTDKDGGEGQSVFQYVVAYDPNGGFVTGGGWIDSPAGAYSADPALTGKATFGFVARYQRGANVPSGNTQFQFKAGDLAFKSTEYEWLVVAGARAQFKGSGTINGVGDYGFLLVGIDGQVSGGGGVDRFRIKIWDKATDEVVYDNQMGADDDSDDATALGGGSIQIH
jgi:hypothetical protein